MYPSEQKPYAGVFVKNQYEYFIKNYKEEYSWEIFYMKRTFNTKLGSIIKYLKASFLFFKRHLFKSYDIIHLHFYFPLIIVVYIYQIFHPRTKLVVTFHGNDVARSSDTKFLSKIFQFFARKIDFSISVGQELSRKIESNLKIKTNKVLCAGVDENMFFPLNKKRIKKFDYIFVGSFVYRKGIDIVIEAIKALDSKEIKFCFVGSGPFYKELEQLKKNFNISIFKNRTQDELRELYNESKFLLFPSRDEPFGLVATESIFCGTPIIVSDKGGLKDQLIENKTGFFANTIEEIVVAITKTKEFNEEEYSELAKNCSHSNKQYSLSSVSNEVVGIYNLLLTK